MANQRSTYLESVKAFFVFDRLFLKLKILSKFCRVDDKKLASLVMSKSLWLSKSFAKLLKAPYEKELYQMSSGVKQAPVNLFKTRNCTL